MVHVFRGKDLMLDRHGRRYRLLLKNVKGQPDDVLAVLIAKERNIANQACTRFPEFHTSFHAASERHNRAILRSPRLLESIQCAESAGVECTADESSPG